MGKYLRINNRSLEIDKGLWKNCGVIEDEAHFILKCKVNQNKKGYKIRSYNFHKESG